MSRPRERDVTASFVTLATALATGADVVDLLTDLTADCSRLLDIASAGLLLADGLGTLHVMATTSPLTRDLELFQTQRDQGPCLDCYRSGSPVSVPDLNAARSRWPGFAEVALAMGFVSVHALPMRLREQRLGALGLFGHQVGALNSDDLSLGQALADVASVAIVQNTRQPAPAGDAMTVTGPLQAAIAARVVVEQAKGVLAHTGALGVDVAFSHLRRYAAEHNYRLTDLAEDVVRRRIAALTVLEAVGAGVSRPGSRGGQTS